MKVKRNKLPVLQVLKTCLMLATILGTTFMVKGQQNTTQTESSNPNVRLGQKALMDGDFKAAASHLQKAMPSESGNPNVLYMLGYSQYHSQAYSKAVSSFSKVIGLKPDYGTAYYYRGKTRNTLSQAPDKMSDEEREKLLKGSIDDFSKAIELDSTNLNFYQNRAVSYRDLGNLLGTKGLSNYDKEEAANAYNASIKDFEYVLFQSPGRKDVAAELKKAKIYRDNIK